MCIRDSYEGHQWHQGIKQATTDLNKLYKELSALPVSYTHLDVYKRQGLYSLESKTALATPCLLKITVGEHNYETHDPYT